MERAGARFWWSAPYVVYMVWDASGGKSLDLECHPAAPHGPVMLFAAFLLNTVDLFLLQIWMYTAHEWNLLWSGLVGGVQPPPWEPPRRGCLDPWCCSGGGAQVSDPEVVQREVRVGGSGTEDRDPLLAGSEGGVV